MYLVSHYFMRFSPFGNFALIKQFLNFSLESRRLLRSILKVFLNLFLYIYPHTHTKMLPILKILCSILAHYDYLVTRSDPTYISHISLNWVILLRSFIYFYFSTATFEQNQHKIQSACMCYVCMVNCVFTFLARRLRGGEVLMKVQHYI